MRVWFCVVLYLLLFQEAYSQEKRKVKVQYKKYEYLDLGKLKVEGNFMAPTDIFIQEQAKKNVKQRLYDRKHFKKETYRDVLSIR